MVLLKAYDETDTGFQTEVHIEGEGVIVANELVSILDRIYLKSPQLFELVLLHCQYTKDHT